MANGNTPRARARGGISRREFLRLGGAGLAALGAAGCGGGGEEGSAGAITFIPDQAGGLKKFIDKFNRQ